jgi:hypothetical protein
VRRVSNRGDRGGCCNTLMTTWVHCRDKCPRKHRSLKPSLNHSN